jgi:hypothetical protein
MNGQAGKGDTYRPVNKEKFDANYEAIFGKQKSEKPTKGKKT